MHLSSQQQAASSSPAEMKFWHEWADKAPQLIRAGAEAMPVDPHSVAAYMEMVAPSRPWGLIGFGAGTLIAAGAFHNSVKGAMRWALAGAGAAVAAAGSYQSGVQRNTVRAAKNVMPEIKASLLSYADKLEASPELRSQLAGHMATYITAEQIQAGGLESSIIDAAAQFGINSNALAAHLKGDQAEMAKAVLQGMFNLESASQNRHLLLADAKNMHAKEKVFSR